MASSMRFNICDFCCGTWIDMASSSNSSTIDNVRFDTLTCECGRKATILVSRSAKNPGRLYYGCSNHGWLKWVVPENTVHNGNRNHMLRRTEAPEHNVVRSTVYGDENVKHNLCLNCNTVVWWLVIINLVLLAACLISLIIQLLR